MGTISIRWSIEFDKRTALEFIQKQFREHRAKLDVEHERIEYATQKTYSMHRFYEALRVLGGDVDIQTEHVKKGVTFYCITAFLWDGAMETLKAWQSKYWEGKSKQLPAKTGSFPD